MRAAVVIALVTEVVLFAPSPAAAHSARGEAHQHYAVELSKSTIMEGDNANTVNVTVRCTANCILPASSSEQYRHAYAYIDISINTVPGVSLSTHKRASFQSNVDGSKALMGRPRGTDMPIRITLTDDAIMNGNREVTVSISALYRPGSQNYFCNVFDIAPVIQNATLTILDNELPQIVLSLGATTIAESGAGNSTTVRATLGGGCDGDGRSGDLE